MTGIKAGTALVTVLVMGIWAPAAEAQRGPGRRAELGRRAEPGVEQVLRLRQRLELTDDQITQLQDVRRQAVADRRAGLDELMDLRSRVEAGDATRDDLRAAERARRDAAQARREEHQNQINSILTEQQREQLSQLRPRARGVRPGVRGRSPRGFRRGGRGFRDRSFGPRGRWDRGRPGRGFRPPFRESVELGA